MGRHYHTFAILAAFTLVAQADRGAEVEGAAAEASTQLQVLVVQPVAARLRLRGLLASEQVRAEMVALVQREQTELMMR